MEIMVDLLNNNPTIVALEKSLDAAALRQRVIANNIANVNTPGFKKSGVTFEKNLKAALGESVGTADSLSLARTNPQHMSGGTSTVDLQELAPEVQQDLETSNRADGNNVDIDEEMLNVSMNNINYNMNVQQLNERLGILRYVINEGRR
ncbi:MAG: flagellar basal body rod protein FlgB [Bacillota bacterium]